MQTLHPVTLLGGMGRIARNPHSCDMKLFCSCVQTHLQPEEVGFITSYAEGQSPPFKVPMDISSELAVSLLPSKRRENTYSPGPWLSQRQWMAFLLSIPLKWAPVLLSLDLVNLGASRGDSFLLGLPHEAVDLGKEKLLCVLSDLFVCLCIRMVFP